MDWRLILGGSGEGAWNMALDEALLASAAGAGQGGCLRFYGWSRPTLSLGYFQRSQERAVHPASRDCPLVRRATGGGAIIHDRELTYSLTVPAPDRIRAEHRTWYDVLHGTLIETLAGWGVRAEPCSASRPGAPGAAPFLCFQRLGAGDVLVGGRKIAGSAQRRHLTGLLQHGSVLLGQSLAAPELPGVEELSQVRIDPWELARSWTRRLGDRLGVCFVPAAPTPEELAAARWCEVRKFRGDQWTYHR